ncbi:MAG: CPBP family intramembrane metalloprotease [Firmicutes bacterium]|nr:CPBP family intramembrane metalloprotease [Bacillota bacterium]
MEKLRKYPILSCISIFMVCAGVRIIEYFGIRTDETFFSENFIHKIFGIVLLYGFLRFCNLTWQDIGFKKGKVFPKLGNGFLLGTVCFFAAYSIECLILYFMNHNVHLEFYVSGFSLTNDMEKQTGIGFILLCILFNVVNVWMEEGVFRGLFSNILKDKTFKTNCFAVALLFGIWHFVMPLRDYLDGNSSLINMLVMTIGYIFLSGIMSIKWSLLYKISGNLWIGLADHLFNNVIVTNLLHVVSSKEADSLQIVRILLGQLISFGIVYLYYKKKNKEKIYE